MDVNNTKFHLISGELDWLNLLVEQSVPELWWDRARQSVSLAPIVQRLPKPPTKLILSVEHRRGAAFDHYGNAYWIGDDAGKILFRPAATPAQTGSFWSVEDLTTACEDSHLAGEFGPLRPAPQPQPPKLRGLVVSAHEYLVVGTLAPPGLLVFDLHAGGPPSWLRWPDEVPFAPFDIAPAPDGGVWILDRGPASGAARFWRLDRFFNVVPCSGSLTELEAAGTEDFQPVAGEVQWRPARLFHDPISLDFSSPVVGFDPIAIESLPDGSVMILASSLGHNVSIIHYYRDGKHVDAPVLDSNVIGRLLEEPGIQGHDFVFKTAPNSTGNTVNGSLYVASMNGMQAFLLSLKATAERLDLVLQPPFLPMRAFSGKALIEVGGEIYYDHDERWLPLTEQPRRRYVTESRVNPGERPRLKGIECDGREPDCIWHRLMMDACIPEGTAIMVESRTANQRELLQDALWHPEPRLYLRAEDSEIPLHHPFDEKERQHEGTGTWELLFQNAKGRWIELRLTLHGTGRLTPRMRALRAYYPRFSYLKNYLPAVYQDDRDSASFLDRFLANVEGLYTTLEGRIERSEALFDTRTAPEAYIQWLAGWIGSMLDPTWNEDRKRLFLDNAELLFRWRGTQIGIRAAIRLSINECPAEHIFDELRDQQDYRLGTLGGYDVRIVEQFLARKQPGIVLGDPTGPTMLGLAQGDVPWEPANGAQVLHQRFQDFMREIYADGSDDQTILKQINDAWGSAYENIDDIQFAPILPTEEMMAADWMRFVREAIGFTYAAVTDEDTPIFQEFLARRYHQIDRLNSAYGMLDANAYTKFEEIGLPPALPTVKKLLSDWIEFVSLTIPIKRSAHRFTVLVPTKLGELPQSREQRQHQVEEIVRREKPAHTNFEVKLYWALFQIGSARLGLDTTIGEGSRFTALVLGSNYLGQSFLTESHPWCVYDRTVVGRDRLKDSYSWRT